MKKACVVVTVVLLALGAAWAQQQTQPQQPAQAQPQPMDSNINTPASAGGQVTLQGCLSGGMGNYALRSSDGMTYQLQGSEDQFKEHVGNTVAVTGTLGPANTAANNSKATESNANAASSSGAAGEQQRTLNVSSLQHISASCSPPSPAAPPKK